jgi:hypothetical protein
MAKTKAQPYDYNGIDPDFLKGIANFIIDRLREEEANMTKARYDRSRANTKTLLRNYRSFVEHCENAVYEASQMDDDVTLAEFLDLMGADKRGSFKIESIRTSAARTRLIIDHIDEMLEIYRIYCEQSTKPEDARRYRVIYALYISHKPKSTLQISFQENVDERTVYRDIDVAVEKLTALFFGIDGIHILKR